MSGGSFESSQRTEPVCASRFSSIKNCFKTRASGLARGRGWSRIGHSGRFAHPCRSCRPCRRRPSRRDMPSRASPVARRRARAAPPRL